MKYNICKLFVLMFIFLVGMSKSHAQKSDSLKFSHAVGISGGSINLLSGTYKFYYNEIRVKCNAGGDLDALVGGVSVAAVFREVRNNDFKADFFVLQTNTFKQTKNYRGRYHGLGCGFEVFSFNDRTSFEMIGGFSSQHQEGVEEYREPGSGLIQISFDPKLEVNPFAEIGLNFRF